MSFIRYTLRMSLLYRLSNYYILILICAFILFSFSQCGALLAYSSIFNSGIFFHVVQTPSSEQIILDELDGYTTDDITYRWKDKAPVQIAEGLNLPRFSVEKYKSKYCNVKTNTGRDRY